MTLAPYDAVCVVSYGGPDGPDDVLPFMRNATRGRGVPDERLVEVSGHYALFGGRSPINERNAELVEALRGELSARGVDVPVVIGNRNWHPFLADTLAAMRSNGASRVLCCVTSAYGSYSGCRQYREDLAGALSGIDGLTCDVVGPFADSSGFVEANADGLRRALDDLPGAHVLFVTHSIPVAMDEASGGTLGTYVTQHRRAISRVLTRLHEPGVPHELVFCSRSGAPHIPWLEPDINDRLTELADEGVRDVVVAPIGFLNDHMEVVFDLDTQAAETAAGLGMRFVRAATAGTHPAMVASLADAIVRRAEVARGQAAPASGDRYDCPSDCCPSGRTARNPQ